MTGVALVPLTDKELAVILEWFDIVRSLESDVPADYALADRLRSEYLSKVAYRVG